MAQSFHLEHPTQPRLIRYTPRDHGRVTIETYHGGIRVAFRVLTLEKAREHYDYCRKAHGYAPVGFLSNLIDVPREWRDAVLTGEVR